MIKIDRETCPPGTRLLCKPGNGLGVIALTVIEWSPGGYVCVGRDKELEWYGADEIEPRVVEILPADPAVPAPVPWDSGWKDVWPSEIPDGSVWELERHLDNGATPRYRLLGAFGHMVASTLDGVQAIRVWHDGDRIRRVG